jgi:hypothetical protein
LPQNRLLAALKVAKGAELPVKQSSCKYQIFKELEQKNEFKFFAKNSPRTHTLNFGRFDAIPYVKIGFG